MTVSQARSVLPDLLTRVEDGEEIVITRHGRPVAVLVRPDVLRSRHAQELFDAAGKVRELLSEAEGDRHVAGRGVNAERAEELIRGIRAARDAG